MVEEAAMYQVKRTATPLRREEIRLLAEHLRTKFFGRSIEWVADREGVMLHRIPGPISSGGFSHLQIIEDSERILRPMLSIVINPLYCTQSGEPVREAEIFWHEYFHLFYSPNGNDLHLHPGWSMGNVLHAQEERRAQEFAAHMLIESIPTHSNVAEIAEQYAVSESLAALVLKYRETAGFVDG